MIGTKQQVDVDEDRAANVLAGILITAGCAPTVTIECDEELTNHMIVRLPGLKSVYRIAVERMTDEEQS